MRLSPTSDSPRLANLSWPVPLIALTGLGALASVEGLYASGLAAAGVCLGLLSARTLSRPPTPARAPAERAPAEVGASERALADESGPPAVEALAQIADDVIPAQLDTEATTEIVHAINRKLETIVVDTDRAAREVVSDVEGIHSGVEAMTALLQSVISQLEAFNESWLSQQSQRDDLGILRAHAQARIRQIVEDREAAEALRLLLQRLSPISAQAHALSQHPEEGEAPSATELRTLAAALAAGLGEVDRLFTEKISSKLSGGTAQEEEHILFAIERQQRALMEVYTEQQRIQEETLRQLRSHGEQISTMTIEVLGSTQFQDITRQKIEQAVESLTHLIHGRYVSVDEDDHTADSSMIDFGVSGLSETGEPLRDPPRIVLF